MTEEILKQCTFCETILHMKNIHDFPCCAECKKCRKRTLQEYLAIFREHAKTIHPQQQEGTEEFNLPLAFVAILEAILKLQGWSDP
jgi:hypothetical protein